MADKGNTEVDFGAFPGTSRATVTVTGQAGILAGSCVEAWLYPKDTTDHTVDEHIVDGPLVFAADIVAGVGFTIYADASNSPDGVLYGKYSVGWVWALGRHHGRNSDW
jgi:hypothetical protein